MTLARQVRLSTLVALGAALVLAALAGSALLRWHRAVEALRVASRQDLVAERLRGDLFRQVKDVNDWLFYGDEDPEIATRLAGALAGVEREIGSLEREAGAERLIPLRALHAEIARTNAAVLDLLERGESGAARGLMERSVEARLFERFDEALGQLQEYAERRANEAVSEIAAVVRRAGLVVAATAVLAAIGAGALLAGAHGRLIRPLERLAGGVERIGRGDLAHRIPVERSDELGALAGRVNAMAAALDESRARQVRIERLAAVGELAPYLAHNLRNPLASVRSAAQLAVEDLAGVPGETAAQVRGTLREIVDAVDRLDGWIDRVLVSIRPIRLAPAATDLGGILDGVVGALRLAAARRRVALALETAEGLPPARIDREAIEQALAAIVTNAIEASPAGGTVRITAVRHEGDGAPAGAIAVTVTDEGPGVPDGLRERLFTPAFTTKRDGRGIGLWLARSVVESHGGTVGLDPAPAGGTAARVVLPVA